MSDATINKKDVDPISNKDDASGYGNNEINTSSTDHRVTMTTLEVEDKGKAWFSSQKFSYQTITSNLAAHAWSIKYR